MSELHAVLCWPVGELVMGVVVGTELSLTQPDERGVIGGLQAELSRDEHAIDPVLAARLERISVAVRPAWRDDGVPHFLAESVSIPVDVVICTLASGVRVALPRLGRQFAAPREDLVKELVREEVAAWASGQSPDAIFAELLVPAGRLVTIPARRTRKAPKKNARRELPAVLMRVAEQEPQTRSRPLTPGAWTRDALVSEVVAALEDGHAVVVIGGPGTGKSTVLDAAIRAASRNPDARTFWRTTTHRIVSGTRWLGEWQARADEIADALGTCDGTLWVEDLQELFLWGQGPDTSIAAYWRQALRERRFGLCGEMTEAAWEATQSALPDVTQRFTVFRVEEPLPEARRVIVDQFAELARMSANVEIPLASRRRTVRLLERFVRHERFPGKAIRFLRGLVDESARAGSKVIDERLVTDAFTRKTGLCRDLVDDDRTLTIDAIEAAIGGKIVDQPAALSAAARTFVVWKAGLNDPKKPVATLLFAGPTGVGKTATARAMARFAFGTDAALIRVDMSELGHPAQIERLIGTRRTPGELQRKVRERPFAVVLFDEIEKAHPLFFDVLLSVLDEGRLVDAVGRDTDFRGAIVIMTTNLGTRGASLGFADDGAGFDPAAVRAFFRPEFYNRIDEVIAFRPLAQASVARIAKHELADLANRPGITSRALDLSFTEALVARIVDRGFDPKFGARPLQRAIEQLVVAALARALVDEPDLMATDLTVDWDGERCVVARRVTPAG